MKVFFLLIVFSIVLATCQGYCMTTLMLPKYKDGKEVPHTTCPGGGKEHLIGSVWYSEIGLRCECKPNEWICCETSDATVESMTLPPNL